MPFGSNCSHRSQILHHRSARSTRSQPACFELRARGRRDRRALSALPPKTCFSTPPPNGLRRIARYSAPDRRPDVVRSPVGRNHELGGEC
jgi:hypothetical protein